MRIAAASQPVARPASVDPSRAWILGLVVDADGSVSDAAPAAPEWPAAPVTDGTAVKTDQILTPDGPSVRP